jgi:glycosyltransferase involved in cell wall biosynthesis
MTDGSVKEKGRGSAPRLLMLVENVSVPTDRRAWPECRVLRKAGYDVTVICPRGWVDDQESFEIIEGVEIHRFPLTYADGSTSSYLREYASAFWHTARLVRRLSRRQSFDLVQACNPPDLLLLAAWPLKRRGARFIFDHHDLVPELYLSRFGHRRDLLFRLTLALERLTFRLADVVISTNESYRRIALSRGGKRPDEVFVARNAPDLRRFSSAETEPELKRGRTHLLSYVGMMGPQDGVDYALRALALLRERRDDWHALFIGGGDVVAEMEQLAHELRLGDVVEFTGYVSDVERVKRAIATSDVCLSPEPKNPLNDKSTMIKIAEYMALGRPVVCFDLTESRVTAREAALYAEPNDVESFARCIDELLDDPGRREAMGATGRARVQAELSWAHSERELLAAYRKALSAKDGSGRHTEAS